MKRTVSNSILFQALKKHFSQTGFILEKATGLPQSISVELKRTENHLIVNDRMFGRCYDGDILYLPDRKIIDRIILKEVCMLPEIDQLLLKVDCGIGNPMPKSLEELFFLARQNKLLPQTKQDLERRLFLIGRTVRSAVRAQYRLTLFKKKPKELMRIKSENFIAVNKTRSGQLVHVGITQLKRRWWEEASTDKDRLVVLSRNFRLY